MRAISHLPRVSCCSYVFFLYSWSQKVTSDVSLESLTCFVNYTSEIRTVYEISLNFANFYVSYAHVMLNVMFYLSNFRVSSYFFIINTCWIFLITEHHTTAALHYALIRENRRETSINSQFCNVAALVLDSTDIHVNNNQLSVFKFNSILFFLSVNTIQRTRPSATSLKRWLTESLRILRSLSSLFLMSNVNCCELWNNIALGSSWENVQQATRISRYYKLRCENQMFTLLFVALALSWCH